MASRREILIGNRAVGDGHPCLIIADGGSCHGADITRAYQLIDTAFEAHADAIAFETFRAERLYAKKAGVGTFFENDKDIFDIVKSVEMPYEWIPKLAKYCEQKNLLFVSTPYDETSADMLTPHVNLFKISSYDVDHKTLIRHVAKKMKPTILSAGAATWEEVEAAIHVFLDTGNLDIILMQSTAVYPAPFHSLNLRVITEFRNRFNVPIGLSDHSRHPTIAPLGAVALGVNCIQKHFMLSTETNHNGLSSLDHKFSLPPHELKEMVHSMRYLEGALGDGNKKIEREEQELLRFVRRSIYAVQEIKTGDSFTPENIAVLRTGEESGQLPADAYDALLGKRAIKDYSKDSLISLDELLIDDGRNFPNQENKS